MKTGVEVLPFPDREEAIVCLVIDRLTVTPRASRLLRRQLEQVDRVRAAALAAAGA